MTSAIREAALTMWRIDTHAHFRLDYGGFEGQADAVLEQANAAHDQ